MDEEQGLGSPLAGGLRDIRRNISSSIFGGRRAPEQVQGDNVSTNLIARNSLALSNVSLQLGGIADQVKNINSSLTLIKDNLSISDDIQRKKELAKQKRESQLAEEGLREGKESELEKKIQFALLTPVTRVAQVARGILGRLSESLLFLAGGWLTVQGLRFLRLNSEGNVEALKKFKDRFLKDLLLMGGLVLGLTVGFGKVLSIIGKLSRRIYQVTFGGLLTGGFKFLGILVKNNVAKFLRFIKSGLGAIGLRGIGLGSLALPGAGIIATLQNRIVNSLKKIPIIGELFKDGRKPFDPKTTTKVAKASWLSKFLTAIFFLEKGLKAFTDFSEMRDKGLSNIKSLAIALGKFAVDIGTYFALVKGTAFALGKIGALIGFGAGMLTGGPVGAALGSTVGFGIGSGLGGFLGAIGYFFPGAVKAVTGGLVDVEKIKGSFQKSIENVVTGAGTKRRGVPPGKIPITNKRGRVVGYKDAPQDVAIDPNAIVGADSVTLGAGQIVPFTRSNDGKNLALNDNTVNIVNASSGNAMAGGTGVAGGSSENTDDVPTIESSNPNDDQVILAASAMNIKI